MQSPKTIALTMIVRNEAPIIARCLRHVLPLIDYVLIVDTGSSDGTPDLIRDFLRASGMPGEVIEEPWRDFAYNRTFALQKLRAHTSIDYSLMIDADQIVLFDDDFDVGRFKQELACDLYDVRQEVGGIEYWLPQLASNRIDIAYRGVLHEFRECAEDCSRGVAQGLLVREIHDGARSRNPQKYGADAKLLEHALESETDPFLIARYKFYLAQSYRDAGQHAPALAAYLDRARLGSWPEEVFYSLYSAAKLQEVLRRPAEEIITTYLEAHQALPRRAEALHGAARFCRAEGLYDRGYAFARKALQIPRPQTGLFVERWIYDFGALDEYASLAFLSGHYAECVDACMRMLSDGKLPDDQVARIRENAHHAIEKCGPAARAEGALAAGSGAPPTPASLQVSADRPASAARPDIVRSRYAIVTPYYRESRATLERCLKSVRRQSVRADHIVVADGFPQSWIDDEPVRHLRLDAAHADYGDTPRGLGALLAVAEGYEAVGLLDADNWLADDHVEKCLGAAAAQPGGCDFVIARRYMVAPDGAQLPCEDESPAAFSDTSCFFLLPGAFHALHHWVLTPKPLSPICDRIFYAATRTYGLRPAIMSEPTVYYECLWSSVYEALGLRPPPGAKPNVDFGPMLAWLNKLSHDELILANKRAGSVIRETLGVGKLGGNAVGRNALCPCGSGKRYKHCHGDYTKTEITPANRLIGAEDLGTSN